MSQPRLPLHQAFHSWKSSHFLVKVPNFCLRRCRTSQWRYDEDVRDGVQVVREVFLEGGFEVLVEDLGTREQERRPFTKPTKSARDVEVALSKLPYGRNGFAWLVEIEEPHPLFHQFASPLRKDTPVLRPASVVLLQGGWWRQVCEARWRDLAHGIVESASGKPGGGGGGGVQLSQLLGRFGSALPPDRKPAQRLFGRSPRCYKHRRIPARAAAPGNRRCLQDEGVIGEVLILYFLILDSQIW